MHDSGLLDLAAVGTPSDQREEIADSIKREAQLAAAADERKPLKVTVGIPDGCLWWNCASLSRQGERRHDQAAEGN